jgi:hypothetical protein
MEPEQAEMIMQKIIETGLPRDINCYIYSNFLKDWGGFETGNLTDLIVLSGNILEAPLEDILRITVGLTMVGGAVIYEK